MTDIHKLAEDLRAAGMNPVILDDPATVRRQLEAAFGTAKTDPLAHLEDAARDSMLAQEGNPDDIRMDEHGYRYSAWRDEAHDLGVLMLRLNTLRMKGYLP